MTPHAAATTDDAAPRGADGMVGPLRAVVALLLLGLVALGAAWELQLAPTGRGTLAVKVLPLLLALPGVLRHRLFTYRWLSLLVWLYVLEGLLRATTESGLAAGLAAAQTALAVLLFALAGLYIRRRLRGARHAPAASAASAASAAPAVPTAPAK